MEVEKYQYCAGFVVATFFAVQIWCRNRYGKTENGWSWSYILITVILCQQLLGYDLPLLDVYIVPFGVMGTLLSLWGIYMVFWTRVTRAHTWGVMGAGSTGESHKLITTGPYAFSRHPFYVGLSVYLVGFELICNSLLILLLIPWCVLWIYRAREEERELARMYGDAWIAYSRKTKFF